VLVCSDSLAPSIADTWLSSCSTSCNCCLPERARGRQHTSTYVSIRQHTSAYVSIRQHTSACVNISQMSRGSSPALLAATERESARARARARERDKHTHGSTCSNCCLPQREFAGGGRAPSGRASERDIDRGGCEVGRGREEGRERVARVRAVFMRRLPRNIRRRET
jgi:hypothetical protein